MIDVMYGTGVKRRFVVLLCAIALTGTSMSNAIAEDPASTRSVVKLILTQAKKAGYPVRDASGAWSAESARTFCALRELLIGDAGRARPTSSELTEIDVALKGTPTLTDLALPVRATDGVNVSVHCQIGYFVADGVVQRVFALSSGKKSTKTDLGLWRVGYQVNGWKESSLYPGSFMYKPSFFNKNEGIHGMKADSMVPAYPASHGCVRVLHKDADWLFPRIKGSKVRVYGKW